MIEDEVTDMVCAEMSGMGPETLSQSLAEISELFEPYLIDGPSQRDPLDAQNNLVVPEGTGKLIDFQNLGNSTPAMLMSWALEEANTMFSIHREDETTGETDLGINIMVRDMLLDQDGTYHMNVADFFEDPTIFQGHDMITETTMTVTAVRVRGMDSFRNFEPLVAIGAQTFRSNMAIDEIDLEIDLTLVMKSSTHETSIIVNTNNPPVVEHITLTTGIRDMEFSAGILMAIDGDALGDLQLGALLHMDQMIGCALSTVVALDVSQLSVSIGDIVPPQMNGFISVGLDRVANELVNTVFHMYEAVALKAMPHFFETEIRETIVNTWLDSYVVISMSLTSLSTLKHPPTGTTRKTLSALLPF